MSSVRLSTAERRRVLDGENMRDSYHEDDQLILVDNVVDMCISDDQVRELSGISPS